jgi:hypothetical protein
MNFNRLPVRQWKHREFEGLDPWAANRTARWSIVTFRMVPASMVAIAVCDPQNLPAESNAIPKKYAIGICQETNGRYRILPAALAAAWRAHQVPDRDLPGLLYRGEEPLRRQNDLPGPPSGRALWHAILVAAVALGMFGYYLRLLLVTS